MSQVNKVYKLAQEQYESLGVHTQKTIERLASLAISIYCWQGDDVDGFENPDEN